MVKLQNPGYVFSFPVYGPFIEFIVNSDCFGSSPFVPLYGRHLLGLFV